MPLSASINARLQHQHETVHEIIKGLTEEKLRVRVNPAKWSAYENIAHLVSYQPVFLDRLKRIAETDNPVFERYTADNDPAFLAAVNCNMAELISDLLAQRSLIINFLHTAPENILRKTGTHPVYGVFSMNQWADFFLLHESHHLFTIFKLTSQLYHL